MGEVGEGEEGELEGEFEIEEIFTGLIPNALFPI